jgi:hypothetical protein
MKWPGQITRFFFFFLCGIAEQCGPRFLVFWVSEACVQTFGKLPRRGSGRPRIYTYKNSTQKNRRPEADSNRAVIVVNVTSVRHMTNALPHLFSRNNLNRQLRRLESKYGQYYYNIY